MNEDMKAFLSVVGVSGAGLALVGLVVLAVEIVNPTAPREPWRAACMTHGGVPIEPWRSEPFCVRKEAIIEVREPPAK